MAASGADAPAFELSTEAPAQVVLTAPAGGTLSRSGALSVSWSGGQAGDSVNVGLQQRAGTSVNVACSCDAESGTGTVPAAAMQAFQQGPGAIGLGSEARAQAEVAGWEVELTAAQPGQGGGIVTFE